LDDELELEEEFSDEDEHEELDNNNIMNKLGNDYTKKLIEIKSRINEARNLNALAVKEENLKLQDPNYEKSKLREE
jgi:hypothetical protein